MKKLFALAALIFAANIIAPLPASAQQTRLFGSPMVQDSGWMMLDGHTIELWGINMLAGDQQCWKGDKSWACGEEAMTAFKLFAEGQLVTCDIKAQREDGLSFATCWRDVEGGQIDLARHLVNQGLAFAKPEVSGNFYTLDQNEARRKRLGIWTSRFQTAEDWRNSIPNFVGYEMEPEPEKPAPTIVNNTIVNHYTNRIFTNPDQKVIVLPSGSPVIVRDRNQWRDERRHDQPHGKNNEKTDRPHEANPTPEATKAVIAPAPQQVPAPTASPEKPTIGKTSDTSPPVPAAPVVINNFTATPVGNALDLTASTATGSGKP